MSPVIEFSARDLEHAVAACEAAAKLAEEGAAGDAVMLSGLDWRNIAALLRRELRAQPAKKPGRQS